MLPLPMRRLDPETLGPGLLLAGLMLFVIAWWVYRRLQPIRDTATSKAASVALGPVELEGTAEPLPGTAPVAAPFSGRPCVFFVVERYVKKGKGSQWKAIPDLSYLPPFALRDETGAITVLPEWGTEIEGVQAPLTPARFPHLPPGFHERMPDLTARSSPKDLEVYRERAVPPGHRLYVLGTAVRREGATGLGSDALVVQKEGRVPFILSDHGETRLRSKLERSFRTTLVASFVLTFVGGAIVYAVYF